MRLSRARIELAGRTLAWRAVWYALVAGRLYRGPLFVRSLAAWGLTRAGSIGYSPRTLDLEDMVRTAAKERC